MLPLRRTIVVLAKHPTPGTVKTRLIPQLGAEQAAELHRHFLLTTLGCVSGVSNAEIVLAVSPDGVSFADVLATQDRLPTIAPQGRGDLGQRLARVLGGCFEGGSERVVAVGCDCPLMEAADIESAFVLLNDHDVVIGPALDGGYYLLGLGEPAPTLFDGIEWSSSSVAAQTRERARAAGLRMAELAGRRDVDIYDDLVALADELEERSGDGRLAPLRGFIARIKT